MTRLTLEPHILSILKDKIKPIPSAEGTIYLVGPIRMPVNLFDETVEFNWYCWLNCDQISGDYASVIEKLSSSNLSEYQQSSVLVYGDFENSEDALIRMHSICHTGDIFGSKRCDCGFQLKQSMQRIADHGSGALFYLANHEGRGIGLFSKAMAYLLQENGSDTVEANEQLGFTDDSRSYEDALSVMKSLRSKPVNILTNNPKKVAALESSGLQVSGRTALWGDESEFNSVYLQTKVARSGHFKNEEASYVKP
ncbi:MAG TPA: GTP cyclohydrolase II [Planococcus sp. (in: firmicutes)]|nr:GTP cyclohydrolase II [Planococcus sp. (in: firmicutes)]